jgi:hypothetical protein
MGAGEEFAATVCGTSRPSDHSSGEHSDLDGREMPLGEVLDAIIGVGDGAFISCILGRLGFYEYEDMK